jgi:hypothetical protein
MTKSQVVKVVLDQMYELFQIDTSEVWPDDLLAEHGLDEQSIKSLSRSSLVKLGLASSSMQIDNGDRPKTAREVVEQVLRLASQSKDSRTSDAA